MQLRFSSFAASGVTRWAECAFCFAVWTPSGLTGKGLLWRVPNALTLQREKERCVGKTPLNPPISSAKWQAAEPRPALGVWNSRARASQQQCGLKIRAESRRRLLILALFLATSLCIMTVT